MNKIVEGLLKERLADIEDDIKWERDTFTELTRGLEQSSRRLDTLNQEKRAIKDHLEAAK